MDEGWTRWILEQFGWEYASVGNAQLRAGNLRDRFDAIIFAEQSAAAIHSGFRGGTMPEEFTGGVGEEGAAALKAFAAQGGKIVFLNDAAEYAVDHLGVSAKNVLRGVSNRDFYCPGSLLNVKLEAGHPLGFGLPPEFTVWFETSPVFEPADAAVKPVLRFRESDVLASGWLLGEKHLAGKPALLDASLGQGRVILFGLRPQYRAQSWLTLKLLFNALVY
jgi:hypothetical protein